MTNKNKIRSNLTRKRLINKLSEIIRNGEIDNFTIRGLCNELDLSPRTFYLYFESKEQAINQCYIFQEEIFVEKIKQLNKETIDPWDRLFNIFKIGFKLSIDEIVTVQRRLVSVLNVYDQYINSQDIAFYQMVHQELENCTLKKNIQFSIKIDDLTWELILFYRGIIYNYMACHGHTDILEHALERIERYTKTFIV